MALFAKKVTCEMIEGFLDQRGWQGRLTVPEPGEEEGVVMTGWRASDGEGSYKLLIDPILEQNVLLFRVPAITHAPPNSTPAEHLNGLLMAMAAINYRTLVGSWALDPSDGEVVYKAGLPIDAHNLSFEDFDHCLKAVAITVEQYAPKLRAIASGEATVAELFEDKGIQAG